MDGERYLVMNEEEGGRIGEWSLRRENKEEEGLSPSPPQLECVYDVVWRRMKLGTKPLGMWISSLPEEGG